MKVAIPSKLVPTVELRQPTLRDIRELSNIDGSICIKNAFVRSCTNDSIDNISILDRDYLFFLCCSSVHQGRLSFKVTCPKCNNQQSVRVMLSEFEVFDLLSKRSKYTSVLINKSIYKYQILTVAQEEWCINKCFDFTSSYDEDIIKDLESSLIIANKKFDYSSMDSFYKSFESLPLRAVAIACDYHKLLFHGVFTVHYHNCLHCGAEIIIPINFEDSSALISSETLMSMYAALSKRISFDDFLSLTVTDYESFVESLKSEKND